MPTRCLLPLLAIFQLFPALAYAVPGDILWLSDVPPIRAETANAGKKTAHSRQGAVETNSGSSLGSSTKHLWLRRGDDLANAHYVAAAAAPTADLVDAKGNRSRVAEQPLNDLAHMKFTFEHLGFHNVYLSRRSIRDNVMCVQLAKAELLKGTCCKKLGDVDPAQMKAIRDPTQPLEIVREHEPDEKLFTRIVSGDKVVFTIYRSGKRAAGIPVTLLTQNGWQKKAVSNGQGQVEFTMIRDYFPAWSEFRRLTKHSFVVVAEAETSEAGMNGGQPFGRTVYQATLSGRYAVSPHDYRSYAWGLGITLFVVSFGGLAIYLYRRRRLKPFKEVRFHEST